MIKTKTPSNAKRKDSANIDERTPHTISPYYFAMLSLLYPITISVIVSILL